MSLSRLLASQLAALGGREEGHKLASIQEEVGARINEKVIAKHFNLEPEAPTRSGSTRKSIRQFNVDDVSVSNKCGSDCIKFHYKSLSVTRFLVPRR